MTVLDGRDLPVEFVSGSVRNDANAVSAFWPAVVREFCGSQHKIQQYDQNGSDGTEHP
jgi:hypothetical protein